MARGDTIRAAIAHLRRDGCDLTDPSIADGIRIDDASFYLGYLEELCGFRLTTREVVRIALGMMDEPRSAMASTTQAWSPFVGMN